MISAACGTVLLFLVFDLLRRRLGLNPAAVCLGTLSLGCFPPFALWSTSGLATVPFALLAFITFERLVLRHQGPDGVGGGIAALLLALIRAEGIAWVAVILVLALIARRIARQHSLRPFVVFILIAGLGYALYFAGRYAYHQVPLPNTAYVKGELDAARLLRGVDYVVTHVLTFLTPILIVPGSLFALRRKRIAIGLPAAAMAWAFPAYAVVVTGDFMAMGRFLVPGLAFNAILLAWMIEDLWTKRLFARALLVAVGAAVIVIGLLPGWNRHLIPAAARERFRFRFNTAAFNSEFEQWELQVENVAAWTVRGRALKSYVAQRDLPDQHPSYVVGAIGATGYYSNLYIYDKHGLVTPEVARRAVEPGEPRRSPGHDKQVPVEHFLKDAPTILRASVVENVDARAVANMCDGWAAALHLRQTESRLDQRYVVDFARVPTEAPADVPRYVITWTRIAEGTNAREAWADFARRLGPLRRAEHLPPQG